MQQARQNVADDETSLAEQNQNTKASQVIQDLVDEGGVKILFSGCFERVVRSAPQFGVTLSVFDILNSMAVEEGLISAGTSI
jgi:hypothetical protein